MPDIVALHKPCFREVLGTRVSWGAGVAQTQVVCPSLSGASVSSVHMLRLIASLVAVTGTPRRSGARALAARVIPELTARVATMGDRSDTPSRRSSRLAAKGRTVAADDRCAYRQTVTGFCAPPAPLVP